MEHSSFPRSHLSRRKRLALRKELLITRSALERATLIQARSELRAKCKRFGWVKWLLPRQAIVNKVSGLIHDYPFLSTISSMLLVPTQAALLRKAKPLIKWSLLGFTAWQSARLLLARFGITHRSK